MKRFAAAVGKCIAAWWDRVLDLPPAPVLIAFGFLTYCGLFGVLIYSVESGGPGPSEGELCKATCAPGRVARVSWEECVCAPPCPYP